MYSKDKQSISKNVRKIRVGVMTTSVDQVPISAPGLCQRELVRAMLKKGDSGIELILIHFRENTQERLYKHASTVLLKRNIFTINRALATLNLDVLHVNHIPYKWLPFFFLPIKKIVTIHGDASLVMHSSYFPFSIKIKEYFIRFLGYVGVLQNIEKFIAVSNVTATHISDYLRVSPRRIAVVHNGVKKYMHPIVGAAGIVRKEWKINQPYILNVNNYAAKKNIETLIEAFALLKSNSSSESRLKLVFAGSGVKDNKRIVTKIRQHNLENDLIFLEHVPHEKLPAIYSAAEMLVNPTLHETFGLPNLEAMACGCPVITSNVYAVPEVVGNAALLVDNPMDSVEVFRQMQSLLSNQEIAEDLRTRGLMQSRKFSWDESAQKVIDLYKSLFKEVSAR